jgi:glutathione-regulated potassium-efflux system ancillary protein KefF
MVTLIFAHPYPSRSRANRRLLEAVRDLDGLTVRSLYDTYPDFAIDVEREQRALREADTVVWQHPMYWYSVPGLMKHWFDKVLTRGFAYGERGNALRGKRCLWVVTTGGEPSAFTPEGMHAHELAAFVPHVRQTARFCEMEWEEPHVVHGAHRVSDAALDEAAATYRRRLVALLGATPRRSEEGRS